MATACFLLFTFLPERPLFNVPFLRSCIAFLTFFEAPLEYFRAMIHPLGKWNFRCNRQNIIRFQAGTPREASVLPSGVIGSFGVPRMMITLSRLYSDGASAHAVVDELKAV